MRSHLSVQPVMQGCHLQCPTVKTICSWNFIPVQVWFILSQHRRLDIRTSLGKFHPAKSSNNLHCEHIYANIYIYICCFCYCLLFSKHSCLYLVLAQKQLYDALAAFQTGILMKTAFSFIFCLCSLLLLLYFLHLIFQRLCFPTSPFEDNFNSIIPSATGSLRFNLASALPSWWCALAEGAQ